MKNSIPTRLNEEMHLPLHAKLINFRASYHLNIYVEFEILPRHIVGVYPRLLKSNNRKTETFRNLNWRGEEEICIYMHISAKTVDVWGLPHKPC